MKKTTAQKKLQLSKLKISNLSKAGPKAEKAGVCLTSLAQTTCPACLV